MKKRIIYVLLAVIVIVLLWTFFVPKSAVNSDFSLDRVERNGLDITGELSESELKELEQILLNASCSRWKNPIGAFPLRNDTIELTGMDSKGRIHFYLVGSTDRYAVNEYNLRNGRQLLESVLELLPVYNNAEESPSEVIPDSVDETTFYFTAEVVKYGNDALYVKVMDAGDSTLSIGDELYVGVANGYDNYPFGCTVEVAYSSEIIVDDDGNYGIGRTISVSPVLSESEAILQLSDVLLKQGIELGKGEEELWWDLSCLDVTEIENAEAYVLDLRYGRNMESVMAGRRFGTFAIAKTGSKAYMLNIAAECWEPLNISE